ncbi:MAG: co-chaperone GroES [Patescibacteria group bacterium]
MKSKKKVGKAPTAKNSVPLKPLGDRVVVRMLTDLERGTTTASGIIIPDSAQEKSSEGVVIAVGPGRFDDGARVPMNVSAGDRVLFSKYGHEEVKVNGVEYLIVSETNILAILNK